MAPYEALYGRKCRSLLYWDEVGERQLVGPEFIQEMKEKITLIRKRMLTAQSRQKSYEDKHHRKLEFDVGDLVYLKVSPMRGVICFGKKGKLSPRFIGPFEVTEIVGQWHIKFVYLPLYQVCMMYSTYPPWGSMYMIRAHCGFRTIANTRRSSVRRNACPNSWPQGTKAQNEDHSFG